MDGDFTDKQVGKRVVAQSGREVGTVEFVENGDIFVEVGADVDADTLDELGWDDTVNLPAYRLRSEYVSTVTADTIRLNV